MKHTLNILTALLLVLASTTVILAAKPDKTWDTPMIAAKHDNNVVLNLRKYMKRGYVLTSEYENAYRYVVPPTGDFLWGACYFSLKLEASDYSLEVSYVYMTAYIDYIEVADGYRCSGFDLTEETVY